MGRNENTMIQVLIVVVGCWLELVINMGEHGVDRLLRGIY
jgi:hypothetical protein